MNAPARWDAELYAANTAHHRAHDDDVLRGVPFPRWARVLDIGCGVGDLTARLARLAPDGDVLGVDADPDMVATARVRASSPVLRFAVARAQELHTVVPARSVDVAVSVACLHWVPSADHPAVLAGVRRVLRGRGVFRAEFGGSGQIADVRALLDEEAVRLGGSPAPWFFPDPEEYGNLLVAAGLDYGGTGGTGGTGETGGAGWVRLVRQRRPMPDRTAFAGWLRSQVLVAYGPGLPADRFAEFRRVAEERALAELRRADGSYDQDYVRLDLLAHAR